MPLTTLLLAALYLLVIYALLALVERLKKLSSQ